MVAIAVDPCSGALPAPTVGGSSMNGRSTPLRRDRRPSILARAARFGVVAVGQRTCTAEPGRGGNVAHAEHPFRIDAKRSAAAIE